MTVAKLIKMLKLLPQDEQVFYSGGEYRHDYRPITNIEHFVVIGVEGFVLK